MQFNADEATTGIMVRHILDGHGYVFYAGQDYGGALEQYLEAGVYAAVPAAAERADPAAAAGRAVHGHLRAGLPGRPGRARRPGPGAGRGRALRGLTVVQRDRHGHLARFLRRRADARHRRALVRAARRSRHPLAVPDRPARRSRRLDRGHRPLRAHPDLRLAAPGAGPGPAPLGRDGRRLRARGAAAAGVAAPCTGCCRCRRTRPSRPASPSGSAICSDRSSASTSGSPTATTTAGSGCRCRSSSWPACSPRTQSRWCGGAGWSTTCAGGSSSAGRPTCCWPYRRWWRCSGPPRTRPGTRARRATWSACSRCWRSGWPRCCRPRAGPSRCWPPARR